MAAIESNTEFCKYQSQENPRPFFLLGDSLSVLQAFPDACIDCTMTSPPYWRQRQYGTEGIGLEEEHSEYVTRLVQICQEIYRVLKPSGSFWLNIGDTYSGKRLLGIPWRVALRLMDQQGWILRNDVIWHKVKGGPDNAKDKLRNMHEHLFHFVKHKSYYYDVDAIRSKPRASRVQNGTVISATGVSGVRYRRQIELCTALSEAEKRSATAALTQQLQDIAAGKVSDFRMIIRGQQRTTHSDSEAVSGRARELKEKGFYFLRYHPKGSKPGDVWSILPEDTQRRKSHFAAYPADLCKTPIMTTCPENGIVLDPFCGTGTTNLVALEMGRKSVGIDICEEYLELARKRCKILI